MDMCGTKDGATELKKKQPKKKNQKKKKLSIADAQYLKVMKK